MLSSIILLLVLSFFPETADAQEHVEIHNNSGVEGNESGTIPRIGLTTLDVTKGIADKLGMKEPVGILVTKVLTGSPAERAGIVEGNNWTNIEGTDIRLGGDIILKAENDTLTDINQLRRVLVDNKTIGDNLKLTIFRNGQIKEINLTIGGLLYEDASAYVNPDIVNFSSYENIDLGFEIKYPINWHIADSKRLGSVIFRSMPKNSDDVASREYLKLDVEYDPNHFKKTIDVVNMTGAFLPNLKIIKSSHNVTLSNNTGAMTIYTYTDSTLRELKVMKAAVEGNDKIYTITYLSDSPKFGYYFPTVEHMLDSFKITSMLPYENFDIGMLIKYPSNWNKIEDLYSPGIGINDVPSVLFSLRQERNDAESLSNNIRIFSYMPYNNDSLGEEVDQMVDYYSRIRYDNFNLINNIQVLNLTDAWTYYKLGISDPVPSYMLNYSYTDNGTVIHETEILTKLNDRVYSVSYYAQEAVFSKHLPTFNKMISSDSFQMFDVLRYEMLGINSSGIIIRYPDLGYPWKITKIDGNSINLMTEDPFFTTIKNDFILSVYSSNYTESPSLLAEYELRRDNHDRQNFHLLNENATYMIDTNLDNYLPAHKISFSYYDKSIGKDVKGVQVYTKLYGNKYIATFLSEYDDYLPIAEEIIDSLKVIEVIPRDLDLSVNATNLGLNIKYPHEWETTDVLNSIVISPPSTGQFYDPFLWSSVSLSVYNQPVTMSYSGEDAQSILEEQVAVLIDDIKGLAGFELHQLEYGTLSDFPSSKIMYSYNDGYYELKEMLQFINLGSRIYTVDYVAEQDEFSSYLPVIETIIHSMELPKSIARNYRGNTGLTLSGSPVDLAINDITNKLYVAIPEMKQIQVIDGDTYRTINNISISGFPNTLIVDPTSNKLYVVTPDTDSIYVIDGSTDSIIGKIAAGPGVADIAIDNSAFLRTLIFVANQKSNSISVIDGNTDNKLTDISTSDIPYGIGIDPIKNQIYVTSGNYYIDVIDYIPSGSNERSKVLLNFSATVYDSINMDNRLPNDIEVIPILGRAYVANSQTNTVSVIDTTSNERIYDIEVGSSPSWLVYNSADRNLYVSNSGENTISVIDPYEKPAQINSTVYTVEIDSAAADIAVNPKTNKIYFANLKSNTVSVMNGATDKTIAAVDYHINDPKLGDVYCDNHRVLNLQVVDYVNNQPVKCIAMIKLRSFTGLEVLDSFIRDIRNIFIGGTRFSYWSNTIGNISETNDNPYEFQASQFGKVTANFEKIAPSIPEGYTTTLLGLTIPAVGAWIYKNREWFYKLRNKRTKSYDIEY